jgi:hypothetical protein
MTPYIRSFRSVVSVCGLLLTLSLVAVALSATLACGTASLMPSNGSQDLAYVTSTTESTSASDSSTTVTSGADMPTSSSVPLEPGGVVSAETSAFAANVLASAAVEFPQIGEFQVASADKVDSATNPEITMVLGSSSTLEKSIEIVIQKNVPDDVIPWLLGTGYVNKQVNIVAGAKAVTKEVRGGSQLVVLLPDHTMIDLITSFRPGAEGPVPLTVDELERLAKIIFDKLGSISF